MATHIISVVVKNQPDVLAQLSGLFGHSGYNIEKIYSRNYSGGSLTKIKIVAAIEEPQLGQVVQQVKTLPHVVEVETNAQSRFSFLLVAYCLCMTLLGNNLPAPLYALYKEEWQLSSGVMTFIYALYALVVIPTIISVDLLLKRFGSKKVLLAGVFCSIMGSFGFLFAQGVNGIFFSRLFQGLSVGILNGIAVVALTKFHPLKNTTKSAFIASIAGTFGNTLAPLISGYLGQYAPFPMQLSYGVHIALAAVGFAGLCFIVEKKIVSERAPRLRLPSISRDLWEPFSLSASTSFLSWTIMSLMLSIMPMYLNLFVSKPSLSLSGTMVALVLGLSTLSQILMKRCTAFRMILTGNVLMALGMLGIVMTLYTQSLLVLLLTTAMIGLGHGPSYAGSLIHINHVSTSDKRTNNISCFYAVTYIGIGVPVLLLGFIGQWVDLALTIEWFTYIIAGLLTVNQLCWIVYARTPGRNSILM